MTITRLASGSREALLRVEGLGASSILADEAGLHVCETLQVAGESRTMNRVTISVEIAASPPTEAAGLEEEAARARAALDDVESVRHVTRRYQFEPTPLVRDAVRGYRTGKIDRVLAGDFDHFS